MLFRYKIVIEYDGSYLSGWQRQVHSPSVQEYIEIAIQKFSNENVKVYGASRTDAGVHAMCQVAHFDLTKNFANYVIRNAINHFLKQHRIVVLNVALVSFDFHARFHVKKKVYLYKILNRDSRPALSAGYVWHVRDVLDIEKMRKVSNILVGTHDFSSFRGAACQAKSPIRTIDDIQIVKNDDMIEIYVIGKSFLYNQVRIIVGCLKKIGQNKIDKATMQSFLLSKKRSNLQETAPACGLYLLQIYY